MIKISFILPMYRAEPYLERVIFSLKEQTLADFEAIFVDDGSPDDSAKVCEQLFGDDERFVLIRKENGGVSSARNAGLERARGEYIAFIDPDDSIEPDTAKVLWELANKEDAQLVIYGRVHEYYQEDELIRSEDIPPKATGVYRDKPCERLFDKIATSYFVTDKLFKRSMIEEHNLRFRDYHIGEDGVFFFEYIRMNPECVIFLDRCLYHYRIDATKTLSTSYHKEREEDNFYLSNEVYKTVKAWGCIDKPKHRQMVQYCVVRDLQMGIKNINLSRRPLRERIAWLCRVMKDKKVASAVKDTPLHMAGGRNDSIKLLLLKLHLYRMTILVSAWNQRERG